MKLDVLLTQEILHVTGKLGVDADFAFCFGKPSADIHGLLHL